MDSKISPFKERDTYRLNELEQIKQQKLTAMLSQSVDDKLIEKIIGEIQSEIDYLWYVECCCIARESEEHLTNLGCNPKEVQKITDLIMAGTKE